MEILEVKYRKALLSGTREVLYDCPKCGSSLTTPVQDMPKGDTCPDCSASLKFSTRAKLLVKEHVLQERKVEEDRLAKKDAKKKIKEQKALAIAKQKEADARLLKEKQEEEAIRRQAETECRMCKGKIQVDAKVCPHCRAWQNPNEYLRTVGCIWVVLMVLCLLFGLLMTSAIS